MADEMKTTRRTFIGGAAAAGIGGAATMAGWAAIAQTPATGDTIRPEDFGAKGDGVTNDSQAFEAMSAHVNRRGGGTIVLRKTTYLVGRQVAGEPEWAFTPGRIIELRDLRLPLVIRGNGARLKCAPGLRYGSFDRRSGAVAQIAMPHWRQDVRAAPYWAMITIIGSTATIEISDVELDGNLAALRIGGPYGDTGIQLPGTGLFLRDNHESEIVRNVHSHHHPQDGIMVDGDDKRRARSRFEDVVCEYNGRQGMSLIAGRGYDFLRCKFNHTGRTKLASAPAAGFDIEAEGGRVNRDLTFTDCEFANNVGCGLVADSGDSEGATFTRCKFLGTTNWSAWPRKPRFVFRGCTFVGTVVHAHVDADPRRATQFHDCKFTDDPRLSPTGQVYLAGKKNNAIVDLAESDNVQFNRCSFILLKDGLLPWSWRALYTDCTMQQAAPIEAYPKGKYYGRSTISGKVDMYGTIVVGTLVVNGQTLTGTQLGGEAW